MNSLSEFLKFSIDLSYDFPDFDLDRDDFNLPDLKSFQKALGPYLILCHWKCECHGESSVTDENATSQIASTKLVALKRQKWF